MPEFNSRKMRLATVETTSHFHLIYAAKQGAQTQEHFLPKVHVIGGSRGAPLACAPSKRRGSFSFTY